MRVNNDHWDLLLEFCEKNKEIVTNRASGLMGRKNLDKLWADLTNQLNSLGFGEKSVNEWKKTLADSKSKVKQKAAKINTFINQTGGGPQLDTTLTAREERLLSLMGMKSVKGDSTLEFGLAPKKVNGENIEVQELSEVSSPSNFQLMDHDYSENTRENIYTLEEFVEENVPNPETQTPKNKESSACPRGSKHRRQKLELSEQLIQMNNNTLAVLKSIDANISRMTDAIVKLSEKL